MNDEPLILKCLYFRSFDFLLHFIQYSNRKKILILYFTLRLTVRKWRIGIEQSGIDLRIIEFLLIDCRFFTVILKKEAITRVGHVLKHSFVIVIVNVCPSTTNIDFRKVSNAYLCDDFLTAHFTQSVFHTLFYISAMQCFIFPILIL